MTQELTVRHREGYPEGFGDVYVTNCCWIADDSIGSKWHARAFAGHEAGPVAPHERLPRKFPLGSQIVLLTHGCRVPRLVLVCASVAVLEGHIYPPPVIYCRT